VEIAQQKTSIPPTDLARRSPRVVKRTYTQNYIESNQPLRTLNGGGDRIRKGDHLNDFGELNRFSGYVSIPMPRECSS
jgi:hypothetical protein